MECKRCGKTYKANSGKQVFCTDRCRVAYTRQAKKGEGLVEDMRRAKEFVDEGRIDTVTDIKPVVFKSDVDVYCEGLGITIWDLMEYHREHSRTAVKLKKVEDNKPIERAKGSYPVDGYPRGYVAPVPGTKAYFLKNGKFYP